MATKKDASPSQVPAQGYILNDQGEEIPITDEMVTDAMKKIKLQSIGAHTGFTKAITDEMIEEFKQR